MARTSLPLRFLFFPVAALSLSGCIGASIYHDERISFEAPQIDPEGTVQSGRSLDAISRADVECIWGPPAKLRRVGEREERWTYLSSDLRWVGVLLVVILPVPMMVPVGHESVTLTLKDDRVLGAEVVKQDESHALFGFVPQIC